MDSSDDARRCSNLERCELHPRLRLDSTREFWLSRFCRADFEACERFRRRRAGEKVPHELLPSGQLLKIAR